MLYVDGTASGTLGFASTGSWDAYGKTAKGITLTKGGHALAFAFDGGSSNYLNLDAIHVARTPTCGDAAPPPSTPSVAGFRCDAAPIAWNSGSGASSYDLVVDGAIACSSSSTSCAPNVANGAHGAYVVAHGTCADAAGPVVAWTRADVATPPTSPMPGDGATASSDVTLAWTGAGGDYDVVLDGKLVCAKVHVPSCHVGALASGSHAWSVVATTACGPSKATAWSFTTP